MTLHRTHTPRLTEMARKIIRNGAGALLLSAPVVGLTLPAVAASHADSQFIVYPRAAVSSEAYRSPMHALSPRPLQPSLASRPTRQPALLAQATDARPIPSSREIVPVAHTDGQSVSQGQERPTSVRAELERLYAEQGQQMPRATQTPGPQALPANTQPVPQVVPKAQPANVQSPDELTYRQKEPGLLAGLFDFSRRSSSSRSTGRGAEPLRPPVEPRPYQPPTYRQQAQQPRTAQAPVANTPGRSAAAQQPQAAANGQPQPAEAPVATPPDSLATLKKATPDRSVPTNDDAFFPSDAAVVTSPRDELAEFFPAEVDAPPAASNSAGTAAANSVKERMQQLLTTPDADTASQAATAEVDGFAMPEPVADDVIVPQPAPAAASEVVTTTVTPDGVTDELAQPAPFFADEERAIDPQERLDVAEMTGETFDPSGADSTAAAKAMTDGGSLMQQIAARDGVGLKGFCPVTLRDERRPADGRAAYVSFYRSKAYYFASAEAKETFDSDPALYAPASSGDDVTVKLLTGETVEGSLDHSVWYKGKLYLFQSAENLKTFMAAPSAMAAIE